MPQQNRTAFELHLLLILPIVLLLTASALAAAPSESVLYSFPGGSSDANPWNGLVQTEGTYQSSCWVDAKCEALELFNTNMACPSGETSIRPT